MGIEHITPVEFQLRTPGFIHVWSSLHSRTLPSSLWRIQFTVTQATPPRASLIDRLKLDNLNSHQSNPITSCQRLPPLQSFSNLQNEPLKKVNLAWNWVRTIRPFRSSLRPFPILPPLTSKMDDPNVLVFHASYESFFDWPKLLWGHMTPHHAPHRAPDYIKYGNLGESVLQISGYFESLFPFFPFSAQFEFIQVCPGAIC